MRWRSLGVVGVSGAPCGGLQLGKALWAGGLVASYSTFPPTCRCSPARGPLKLCSLYISSTSLAGGARHLAGGGSEA
jgi:hypothetical protein